MLISEYEKRDALIHDDSECLTAVESLRVETSDLYRVVRLPPQSTNGYNVTNTDLKIITNLTEILHCLKRTLPLKYR